MQQLDINKYLTSIIKTDYQTTYNYKLNVKDRLDKIIHKIPSNSIINKGRCGIGGTFLEIMADRNSIIIVPTHSIIDDKCYDSEGVLRPNYFVVKGKGSETKKADLKQFLESKGLNKKIFSTPAGIQKIMNCGAFNPDIYDKWFLLLDESHTSITEAFRNDILIPFTYLFNFKKSALITATPYKFSDQRFKSFDIYNITFNDKIGTIKIFDTNNVLSCLYLKLSHPEQFPGRVHIFLNSIKQISSVIKMANIIDCSIFCKDSKANTEKLEGLKPYIQKKPCEENYSKFNFYTSKYFEGWDLNDENSTTIIVSDYKISTLKNSISYKCFQAAGRNRFESNEIIHISNSRSISTRNEFEEIERRTLKKALSAINAYNDHIKDSQGEIKFSPDKDLKNSLDKYSEMHLHSGISPAVLNHFKVDQIVNEEYYDQEFNSISSIKEAWENMGYKTILRKIYTPSIPTQAILRNKTHRIEATIVYLEELDLNCGKEYPEYKQLARFLPEQCDGIRVAYYELGAEMVRSLKGDMKAIRSKVIESQNKKKKTLIKEAYFAQVGMAKQTNSMISETLQRLYSQHGILDHRKGVDTIKVAKAAQIKGYFTKVKPCKSDDALSANGFVIEIY